uniref:Heterokaryon incompatibility domain-containing protein n=1 Tax=Chromera velia CCMP2878 TaxID=1169474 RepID=A0A0G4G015_9ALVE|eukprot:Cvel_19527.t1-p1 / transcript=Cvel_19527.t1 / gene=Cvel_19527 / organism=Chromera_velia_CCMP2878 / gene_product=Phosphatidylinositol 4-phosphate 5-kinase 8, putative / transcript_product=Phosphatidylinositol 4-phosphate 5-kinase 8, putative / location=Cvel_scaffold1690:28779-31630(-) / protein_length=819 / sequence_SO=supercontig / SO=protein_coding / is_pseudo=false
MPSSYIAWTRNEQAAFLSRADSLIPSLQSNLSTELELEDPNNGPVDPGYLAFAVLVRAHPPKDVDEGKLPNARVDALCEVFRLLLPRDRTGLGFKKSFMDTMRPFFGFFELAFCRWVKHKEGGDPEREVVCCFENAKSFQIRKTFLEDLDRALLTAPRNVKERFLLNDKKDDFQKARESVRLLLRILAGYAEEAAQRCIEWPIWTGMEGLNAVPVRFVSLQALKKNKRLPRFGSHKRYAHPLTGEPNANLCQESHAFRSTSTVFIFVSHRWLRLSECPLSHPDDEKNSAFTLIVEGCERIASRQQPRVGTAVFIDYCCLDQDDTTMTEIENLDVLMSRCDVVLTPVVDRDHYRWGYNLETERGPSNRFEDYRAEEWHLYWERGWCRLEAMYATAVPLRAGYSGAERAALFKPCAAAHLLSLGRRLHCIFGTKEMEKNLPLFALPALLLNHVEGHWPVDGEFTVQRDREVLARLQTQIAGHFRKVEEGYEGHRSLAGHMQGKGRRIYTDGSVYEGDFEQSKRHGRGRYIHADGAVYEGDYQNGKKEGFGKYIFASGAVYEGTFLGGEKSGQGRYTYGDGAMYEGEWCNDVRQGHGRLEEVGGAVYEGGFFDSFPHGLGKYVHADGTLHEGEYERGEACGWGQQTFVDGSLYRGDFEGGQMNGWGYREWTNGDTYEGEFRNNKMHGRGSLRFARGEIYEGRFRQGLRHGKGRSWLPGGEVHVCRWRHGEMHGKGRLSYEGGSTFTGNWRHGKREGEAVFKHPNGKCDVLQWRDGKCLGQILKFPGRREMRFSIEGLPAQLLFGLAHYKPEMKDLMSAECLI